MYLKLFNIINSIKYYSKGRILKTPQKRLKAGVIFSRTFQSHPKFSLIGSGRMQSEIVRILIGMGYDVEFAGQEDKLYSNSLMSSDLIVTLSPGLIKLPNNIPGISLLYTCNTHVKERVKRLINTSQKWGLPIDEESSERVFLKAYELANYLLVAENDVGIRNFTNNGIDQKKIRRYNNCCDTDIWIPCEIKADKFRFVCWSSSHGLRKGLPSLIRGWEQWYDFQDAELHLVGMPTTTSDILFRNKRNGEVSKNLFLHLDNYPAQFQPIIKFIAQSHVAVFPTLEDAMPSALQEMVSCGLPAITTRESGFEFTNDFCYYIKLDDPESLANAFEYWYSREKNLHEFGQLARDYMLLNHSWSHFRNRFPEIIADVTGRSTQIDLK